MLLHRGGPTLTFRKRGSPQKVPHCWNLQQRKGVETQMYLARFYLPLRDNAGEAFPALMFRSVEVELSARFGGVTAHLQSPASGIWHDEGETHADEVVIFEVILEEPDCLWWRDYRERLEVEFRQKRILLMLQQVDVI